MMNHCTSKSTVSRRFSGQSVGSIENHPLVVEKDASACYLLWAAFLLLVVNGVVLPAQSPPVPTGQMIDIGERRLHLDCIGSGSPTVLVQPGAGSFAVEWTLVQRIVAPRYRICVYDRAGYAWSDHGPVDEDIAQTVDDLHLLIRRGQIETPAIFVCQSLGCVFARAYQRRFPEQVAGLVFVDATHDEGITLVLHGERRAISLISRVDLPGAYGEYKRSLPPLKPGGSSTPPFDRLPQKERGIRLWAFTKMVHEMGWLPDSLATAESWREEFTALRSQRLTQAHPLKDLPLVVLERSERPDPVWHKQQEELAALSSAGTLIQVKDSGHMIHLEKPDAVAQAIFHVAARIASRR